MLFNLESNTGEVWLVGLAEFGMTSTCNPFICWLAVKDKLATFGRINKWGYVENVNCVLHKQVRG